jgi:hypothetical protein
MNAGSLVEARPSVLADTIVQSVDAALAKAAESRRFTIARAVVDMTADHDAARFLLDAFHHLETSRNSVAPDLDIAVAALRERDAAALGLDEIADSGVVVAEEQTVVHLHRHSAVVFDRAAGRIHALIRNENGVASWQRAKPLQLPLSIFFADRGVDLVHGGLVSLRGNGVLIAGMGGSGKSTLAVASLLSGLDFLADDCAGVEHVGHRFEGSSIFGSGCLERVHLQRFPDLAATLADVFTDATQPKAVLPMARLFAGRMAATTNIRAIVLPRVTGGADVTLRPASGKEALLALAPSSILKRAVPAAGALARMARMARELPVFRLEMGPIDEAGARIRALLGELGS